LPRRNSPRNNARLRRGNSGNFDAEKMMAKLVRRPSAVAQAMQRAVERKSATNQD
jgi:hypothetical protein